MEFTSSILFDINTFCCLKAKQMLPCKESDKFHSAGNRFYIQGFPLLKNKIINVRNIHYFIPLLAVTQSITSEQVQQ